MTWGMGWVGKRFEMSWVSLIEASRSDKLNFLTFVVQNFSRTNKLHHLDITLKKFSPRTRDVASSCELPRKTAIR